LVIDGRSPKGTVSLSFAATDAGRRSTARRSRPLKVAREARSRYRGPAGRSRTRTPAHAHRVLRARSEVGTPAASVGLFARASLCGAAPGRRKVGAAHPPTRPSYRARDPLTNGRTPPFGGLQGFRARSLARYHPAANDGTGQSTHGVWPCADYAPLCRAKRVLRRTLLVERSVSVIELDLR
jgi:hypothetical protein